MEKLQLNDSPRERAQETAGPKMTDCTMNCGNKVTVICMGLIQVLIIVLFYLFAEYDPKGGETTEKYYPMFQDVNIMIFVGFGFLMTFLKRYGYSSFGINMLLAALIIEIAMLVRGFKDMFVHKYGHFALNIPSMFTAEFSAATILISFGALLGKTSIFQLIIIAVIETILAVINELILTEYLQVVDIGGSMLIHMFGAYFGLAVARVLYSEDVETSNKEGSIYHSDLFSLIGTAFLWCYWPSFNAGLADGDERYRAIMNTYLSLAACTVVSFVISTLLDRNAKLDMVHIQNATLAGGVAVGTTADLIIHPYGAILLGCVAACVSVIGFKYISPLLCERLKLHDTCGVNNLHGMPGLLAGIAGAVAAAVATLDTYGDSLYKIFPARAPHNSTGGLLVGLTGMQEGRSASEQGGFQIAGMCCTMGISILGGLLTGLLMKISVWNAPSGHKLFDDIDNWNVPDDFTLESVATEEDHLISH